MESISTRKILLILLIGCIVAALPMVVSISQLPGITRTVVLAGAVMVLNILIGNTGLLSVGQGLFIGVGAYAIAIGSAKFGLSIYTSFAIGMVIAFGLSVVTAAIALRARHLFFALLTLAIGQVGYVLVSRNYKLTGGDEGLVGFSLPDWLQGDVVQHLFAVGTTCALVILILCILASPFGVSLRAVRDNPERVASLGVNPKIIEFAAMVLAGTLGAANGALLAVTDEAVSPTTLSWVVSADLLVMVALGGRFIFLGPIFGVIIVESVRHYLQGFTEHANLVVGLIVIYCVIAFPEGIAKALADMISRYSRARAGMGASPSSDALAVRQK